jgi:hypothetical protein
MAILLDVDGTPEEIDGYYRPDELYLKLKDMGLSRHKHDHLHRLLKSYVGDRAYYSLHASEKTIKDFIDAGAAVSIAGWFTAFGHIITLVGYDDKGWIVQDSNGEWFSWGYVKRPRPLLHYSYGLVHRTCWDAAGVDRDEDGKIDHGYLVHAIVPREARARGQALTLAAVRATETSLPVAA